MIKIKNNKFIYKDREYKILNKNLLGQFNTDDFNVKVKIEPKTEKGVKSLNNIVNALIEMKVIG